MRGICSLCGGETVLLLTSWACESCNPVSLQAAPSVATTDTTGRYVRYIALYKSPADHSVGWWIRDKHGDLMNDSYGTQKLAESSIGGRFFIVAARDNQLIRRVDGPSDKRVRTIPINELDIVWEKDPD